MESTTCWSCGEGEVVPDPDSGALVCTSCGRVHDAGASEFVHQATFTAEGKLDLRTSSYVHHSSHAHYLDQKLAGASAVITSTAARLGLSPTRAEEALAMAKSATGGSLATPGTAFLPALAAACAFLVARSHRLPLSLVEAAEAAGCGAAALHDLASRIASTLSLPPLPSFDYSAALERAVRYSHPLSAVQGEKKEAILSQARFLLRCASKWSLTTGRHPLPLVAGLTALAAEVNGVTGVSVEDIAQDISAVMHTSRRRYKELVDALVHVARKLLPWGADVNAKNLLLNAPVLLRLMEMRSQSDPSEQFLESFAPDMSGIVQTYSSVDNDESKYLQIVPLDDLDFNNFGQQGKDSEGSKISEECLSDMYQNVLKKLSEVKELGKFGKGANKRKRWGRGLELDPWMDSQDDGWIKDAPLEEAADIDIGYDAPPPAFTANIELQKRRRGRIEAAKCRIDAIRKAPAVRLAYANGSPAVLINEDVCPPQKIIRKKKGQKRIDGRNHEIQGNRPAETSNALNCQKRQKTGPSDGIDWEDCVIELLLLHGANEAEIEQGQYRRLLELHVFSSVSGDR
ncbi:hypothetical protein BRADI_3g41330v3 [Brachypodium distachyon]|uniref:TFIIB-type domain-containing protein n=1 Tax=Brachypodium distachyon TaxID=15368 RepID=I1I8Y0_BRADI|nr:hypothetical protein BRADI_3g41330v3 [Brachypodium distachyon]